MNIEITENGQTTIMEAHVVENAEELDALFAQYGLADDELDAEDLPSDVFSVTTHNGWITIENTVSGDHRTFQVKAVTNKKSGLYGKRIVSLLVGPNRDDHTNWNSFGFVTDAGISVWRKFKATDGETSTYQKLAALLEDVPKGENSGLQYHLVGRCRCCNRALSVPSSVRAGIGPICAGL